MTATMQSATTTLSPVDSQAFRNIAGRFASGVTVITTVLDGVEYGTTVSAVSSLSLDPPMMLVCLNRSSTTHDAVRAAGIFAINILAEGQDPLAFRFAKSGTDKFDGADYDVTDDGVPILKGAVASMLCRTTEVATGGTHTVFLAEVLGAGTAEVAPLTYYRGVFGRLERDDEHAVYRGLRSWITARTVAPGATIAPEDVADQLNGDVQHVHNALLRLETESLVERDAEGAYTVAPITSELATSILNSRTGVLAGVVERYLPSAGQEARARVADAAAHLAGLRAGAAAPVHDYLSAVDALQSAVVRLSGSQPIANAFIRLGLPAVWTSTLTGTEWVSAMDDSHLIGLAAAIAAGDSAAAVAEVHAHGEIVTSLATQLITRMGGSV